MRVALNTMAPKQDGVLGAQRLCLIGHPARGHLTDEAKNENIRRQTERPALAKA